MQVPVTYIKVRIVKKKRVWIDANLLSNNGREFKCALKLNDVLKDADIGAAYTLLAEDYSEKTNFGIKLIFSPVRIVTDEEANRTTFRDKAEYYLSLAAQDVKDGCWTRLESKALQQAEKLCQYFPDLAEEYKRLIVKMKKNKAAKKEEIQGSAVKNERLVEAGQVRLKEIHLDQYSLPENPRDYIVVDLETTGVNPHADEILQIAIVDGTGKTILDQLCKPVDKQEWRAATLTNGITPERVEMEPTFAELSERVSEILRQAKAIVGYNVIFDIRFLIAAGVFDYKQERNKIIDVMPLYTEYFNMTHGIYWKDRRRYRLIDAAAECGIILDSELHAHNALADCLYTLGVAQHIAGASVEQRQEFDDNIPF